jgi:hypothetical protein
MSNNPHDPDRFPKRDRPGEPPTLPLPPLWRLIVAGIVIVGFLYLMYITALKESPPPAQSSGVTIGSV